jgi:Protein of unknown function (DUF3341)
LTAGLLAGFSDEETLREAIQRLHAAHLDTLETHTPAPIDKEPQSWVPLSILIGGLIGCGASFLLQTYATTISYPINVGGRPNFGWPAFVPMALEMGLLCAVATGFVCFLIANRLPALYDPIDELDTFRRASRDRYFVAFRSADGAAIGRARAVLNELKPLTMQNLPQ